ncbi:hypothetical protein [Chroogloeocystis siderophila]|uniref:hypothetical protein n=1 Tax=Chroogloeocystis siderophila TaxID=329163 RepID=UPI000A4464E1|nr:hypothetical protein [Chroogloeocystis siderophila]
MRRNSIGGWGAFNIGLRHLNNFTLNRLGIANVFYTFPGGHGLSGADIGWNYFHKHLYDSLAYVGMQFMQAEK